MLAFFILLVFGIFNIKKQAKRLLERNIDVETKRQTPNKINFGVNTPEYKSTKTPDKEK